MRTIPESTMAFSTWHTIDGEQGVPSEFFDRNRGRRNLDFRISMRVFEIRPSPDGYSSDNRASRKDARDPCQSFGRET